MIPIYKPENQSELAVILSILQEHDIPYFVHNGGFGSLYPGLQIELLNRQTIMVPPSSANTAKALIEKFLSTQPKQGTAEKMKLKDKLRIFLEAILFGWFVPGSMENRKEKNENKL
jgi:hypothetical protein